MIDVTWKIGIKWGMLIILDCLEIIIHWLSYHFLISFYSYPLSLSILEQVGDYASNSFQNGRLPRLPLK